MDGWLQRSRQLVGRLLGRAAEDELDSELRFHLDMETEKYLRQGLAPAAARRQAMLAFGAFERVKEECREERRGHALELFWRDVRYAVRSLRRQPAYTVAVVLTLALGIGANSAIFSLVNGVLLQPLPYEDDDRLVLLRQSLPQAGVEDVAVSIAEYHDYRAANRSFAQLAEYHQMTFTLLGRDEPMRVRTGVVSADFFTMLGVRPIYGRTFQADDEHPGAEAVLVLSHDFWRRSFGGDPAIVGQVFEMNNRPHTVIGVLPNVPQFPDENDVYMPTSACPFRARGEEARHENRNAFRALTVCGRLLPGVSLEAARADLAALARRFQDEHPEIYRDQYGLAVDAVALRDELTHRARPTLVALLVITGLVLLIACANVGNLTLARGLRRAREMAVRASLGAGRGQLVRQTLVESTLLGLAGGALGLLLAYGGLGLLITFAARFTPRASGLEIDGWVLLFTLVVSVGTGLLFGTMALSPANLNLPLALREGRTTAGPAQGRLRNLLVIAQVAVSVLLLVAAGLLLRSLARLERVDLGFRPERVLTAQLSLNWSKYPTHTEIVPFFERLLERVQAHPGVTAAAMASDVPLERQGNATATLQVENRPRDPGEVVPIVDYRIASPDYFETLGIPLVRGRLFSDLDDQESLPVALVNQSLARHHWGSEDPEGDRVTLDEGETWLTIVGVVGDVREHGVEAAAGDELYVPMRQGGWSQKLLLRTASDPHTMVREVKRLVHELDPEQPVSDVETMEEKRRAAIASPRLTSWLVGLFAALALAITATGLGGVIAFSVGQRRREVCLRLALGARPRQVLLMILRQGMSLVAIGLVLGLATAFLCGRFLAGFLFEVRPGDLLTFFVVSLVLLLTAAAACLIPARRATHVDPALVLRSD